jgi:hypothetical protein
MENGRNEGGVINRKFMLSPNQNKQKLSLIIRHWNLETGSFFEISRLAMYLARQKPPKGD